ncbi:MAG: DNA adenine methylase [Dialister sp.]|nr:DNA adenine methylase [Dialister sp.]MDY2811801.1 DNA adenine methylase [Dialister sp.]MDY5545015.1 DNA adenine methylase [Dialister sp.]
MIGPVLKWVGGKRQLLREILPRVETVPYTRYVEPFFGGCCLFLPAAGESCHQ